MNVRMRIQHGRARYSPPLYPLSTPLDLVWGFNLRWLQDLKPNATPFSHATNSALFASIDRSTFSPCAFLELIYLMLKARFQDDCG